VSIEERLQRTRVTAEWIGSPEDSRRVEALDQLAKAEAHIEAASKAIDTATAALNRPAATEPVADEGGVRILREPQHPVAQRLTGEIGVRR
jgi:hypothetical protein